MLLVVVLQGLSMGRGAKPVHLTGKSYYDLPGGRGRRQQRVWEARAKTDVEGEWGGGGQKQVE